MSSVSTAPTDPSSRAQRSVANTRAALALTLLASAGAVAIVVLWPGKTRSTAEPPAASSVTAPARRTPLEPKAPETEAGRVPASTPGGDGLVRSFLDDEQETPEPGRNERALREAYVRRQRAEPGWLEHEAATLLASERPAPEKVALLRALEDVGSRELDAWLAQAVLNAKDPPTPHGESVASFALGRLGRRAAREAKARQALFQLAFQAESLPVALRNGAAAAVAAACPTNEIAALERALQGRAEEWLVGTVVLALRPRRAEPPVEHLLELFDTAPEASVEPDAGTTPE